MLDKFTFIMAHYAFPQRVVTLTSAAENMQILTDLAHKWVLQSDDPEAVAARYYHDAACTILSERSNDDRYATAAAIAGLTLLEALKGERAVQHLVRKRHGLHIDCDEAFKGLSMTCSGLNKRELNEMLTALTKYQAIELPGCRH